MSLARKYCIHKFESIADASVAAFHGKKDLLDFI